MNGPEIDVVISGEQQEVDGFLDSPAQTLRRYPESGYAHAARFWLGNAHYGKRELRESFRFMEGFGVHTFRMINAKEESTFVKFHWRPLLGGDAA